MAQSKHSIPKGRNRVTARKDWAKLRLNTAEKTSNTAAPYVAFGICDGIIWTPAALASLPSSSGL